MDSLIQITKNTINGSEINSVNARETYEYLGLAKGQFSRWIKSAIDKAKKKGAAFVAKAVGKMSGKVATLLSGVASAIPLAMIANDFIQGMLTRNAARVFNLVVHCAQPPNSKP